MASLFLQLYFFPFFFATFDIGQEIRAFLEPERNDGTLQRRLVAEVDPNFYFIIIDFDL